jgi:hypothetical protein
MSADPRRDPATRRAALVAALVAVPVALAAGLLVYRVLDNAGADGTGASGGAGASTRPQSTAPVELAAPTLDARPAAVCRALAAKLPDRLGDLTRRPVTAGSEQNAAYGDPPVTVTCGAPGPAEPVGAAYLEVDGVCWYAERGSDSAVWSLHGYEVPLVVTVPNRYTGQLLVDLAKPVTESIPASSDGCR